MRVIKILLAATFAAVTGAQAQTDLKPQQRAGVIECGPVIKCGPLGIRDLQLGDVLVRPKPVCHLSGSNIPKAMTILSDVIRKQGFSSVQPIENEGEIRARRAIGQSEDRIIIWIERDLLNPTKEFKVYVDTALYQPFFGEQEAKPVRITPTAETRYLQLRTAIIEAAAKAKG